MASVKELTSKLHEIRQVFGCGIQRIAKENAHPIDFPQCGLCDKHSEPEEKENETLEEARKCNKWENNIYQFHESAKILWDSLCRKMQVLRTF